MSIQKKTIYIPAETKEKIESITCDICGKVFKQAFVGFDGVEWSNYNDVQRTCVQYGDGYDYNSDEYHIEYRQYHICPNCFTTKLEPWLQSQGVKFTSAESRC